MAEYYVDPENGSDAANGLTPATAWKLIPGQTGANAVIAGDIINVKNGSVSSNGRLIFPANNLTYRGYGVASSLKFLIPTTNVGQTYQHEAIRQRGQHEGYWTLLEPTQTLSIVVFSNRSGCSLEDCCVDAVNSETAISVGTSTSNINNNSVKRCYIKKCTAGIVAYSLNTLIEDVLIENTTDDSILLGASVSNGSKANSHDILRRVSFVNPGSDESVGIGDAFQNLPNGETYLGRLTIDQVYVKKLSNTKQAFVFADVRGGLNFTNFHIVGTPTSQSQVLFNAINANIIVENGYMEEGCASNSFFRFNSVNTQGWAANTLLHIKNVLAIAKQHNGFFTWGGSESAVTVNGTVLIEHCTIVGENVWPFSAAGTISFHPGSLVTIGASANALVRNNFIISSGQPVFKLPTGDENSSKWVFRNNAVSYELFNIGTTSYPSIISFQAAHSFCTNTFKPSNLTLTQNTQLKNQGVFSSYTNDGEGNIRNTVPTVGVFEYVVSRGER